MQNQNNNSYPILEYIQKQRTLSEIDWILSDVKDCRYAIVKHLNRLRTLCRLIKIDTKIPLNFSDTKRSEEAMKLAIDEGNPIVDIVLNYQEVIVHQDKKIDEQKIEVERLKLELEFFKKQ